jgi:hypothetical protein
MITESEIITALSGSMLGDYPAVLDESNAREIALNLFKKILDIDINGGVNSILFYEMINANPSALALTQRSKIDQALANLNNLTDVLLPEQVKKLPFILGAETLQTTPTGVAVTPEIRAVLIQERSRLAELFKLTANIPTILSTTLIE